MSSSEKNTFNSSNDYVIKTARERLEAWAVHEGKTLSYTDGVFAAGSKMTSISTSLTTNNSSMVVIVISTIVLSTVSGYFVVRRRKENN